MRIFLAGATGAVGRPLVHQLVVNGAAVVPFILRETSRWANSF